jgi:hypothetical protein
MIPHGEETGSRRAGVEGRSLPIHAWLGLALVSITWPLNWLVEGVRTHLLFFPMWLGFCLVVDGLAARTRGSSLLTRGLRSYLALFAISIPLWWLFEAINLRTRNWTYEGVASFTDLEYALLASTSFATVLPAVLGASELVAGMRWIDRFRRGPRLAWGSRAPEVLFLVGCAMGALLLAWPRVFFPLTWSFVFCLAEALAVRRNLPSLTWWARRGDWRPALALAAGALICAFFWEMWNYFSYPRWVYDVPGVDFLRVFEMPILGYLGYIPFAWSLYAVAQLLFEIGGRGARRSLLRAISSDPR